MMINFTGLFVKSNKNKYFNLFVFVFMVLVALFTDIYVL